MAFRFDSSNLCLHYPAFLAEHRNLQSKLFTYLRFPALLLTSGLAERPSIEGRISAGEVW